MNMMSRPGLSPSQVAKIEDSFARIAPHADDVAKTFYAKLFQAHPEVRPLFPEDMRPQREKLMGTLTYAVRSLSRFDELADALRDLGRRHIGYRAEPAHYDAVGEALLETLAERLGPHWRPDLAQAWTAAYDAMAQIMIAAKK